MKWSIELYDISVQLNQVKQVRLTVVLGYCQLPTAGAWKTLQMALAEAVRAILTFRDRAASRICTRNRYHRYHFFAHGNAEDRAPITSLLAGMFHCSGRSRRYFFTTAINCDAEAFVGMQYANPSKLSDTAVTYPTSSAAS